MKAITDLNEIPQTQRGVYLTIGNFDGVHLGHRKFLEKVSVEARKVDCDFLVITFVPHPREILAPTDHFLINSYGERRCLIEACGVDIMCEINFTRDFSTLEPREFLDNYIFNKVNVKKLFLGHDFAFGANKSGNYEFVKKYCEKKKVEFEVDKEYRTDGAQISSTEIRNSLKDGKIEHANKLLGREFFISGPIVKGEGRGKKIGFPTANMQVAKDRLIPRRGVYVTQIQYNGGTYHSVTNIGLNPTFQNRDTLSVETFILDFDVDIYGEELTVRFLKKIRDEKKFDSVNELIAQIKKDVEFTKAFF